MAKLLIQYETCQRYENQRKGSGFTEKLDNSYTTVILFTSTLTNLLDNSRRTNKKKQLSRCTTVIQLFS